MRFQPVGADEWLSLDPLQIRTTLKITFDDAYSIGIYDTPFQRGQPEEGTSAPCGLKWQFSCRISPMQVQKGVKKSILTLAMLYDPPTGPGSATLRTSRMTVACALAWDSGARIHNLALQEVEPGKTPSPYVFRDVSIPSDSMPDVVFDVTFSPSPFQTMPVPIPHVTKTLVESTEAEALALDIKFYLFSARTANGVVCRPKMLRSSRALLGDLLSDRFPARGFAESELVDLNNEERPADLEDTTEEYDYDDDSDLEDTADDDTEDDEPFAYGNSNTNTASRGQIYCPKNIAHRTFKALLEYIYTQRVCFAWMRSTGKEGRRISVADTDLQLTPVSPKSIYRLAEMVGLESLKILAKNEIKAQLTIENMFIELFSTFSSFSTYTEIRTMQAKFVVDHWTESAETREDILRENCNLTHAAAALHCLFGLLRPNAK